jgi:hypothetical protein
MFILLKISPSYGNVNIKGKAEMIKMLKRREECNTYLTHICRHQRSGENPIFS